MDLDLRTATLTQIAEHYQAPTSSWVRVNMVVSRDEQFVGANKTSRDLTGSEDLSLLLLLRALSDVLLVGANTARMENYRQPKRSSKFAFLERPTPRLAIVSQSLNFDLSSKLFSGGEHRTLIINAGATTVPGELAALCDIVHVPAGDNFGKRIIAALAEMDLPKVTCEGGPNLLAQLLSDDVVDEYDLAISPIVVGEKTELPNVLPDNSHWDLVANAVAGEFAFQRLLRKRT